MGAYMSFNEILQLAVGTGSYQHFERYLKQCLREAKTFDEFCLLFSTTINCGGQYYGETLSSVRSKALQKLIEIANGRVECERAVALAGFSRKPGQLLFRKKYGEAKKKLDSLA